MEINEIGEKEKKTELAFGFVRHCQVFSFIQPASQQSFFSACT